MTPSWRSAWPLRRVLTVLAAAVASAVLLYPTASSWLSARAHASENTGYAETVDSMDHDAIEAQRAEAMEYNAHLPNGPLRDPFALGPDGRPIDIGNGKEAYLSALDTDPNGVMARLDIPTIDVHLPVYHGTAEETLQKGVGHLYGSGLPVGGAGTHTVLTGHSGLVGSTLFTHLNELEEGDEFSVTVLNQTRIYRVDQVLVVEPEDSEDLRQVPDKDLVTLVTCTPIGVNTHRLLVRGEFDRLADPEEQKRQAVAATAGPGFPWWAPVFVAATTASAFFTRPHRVVAG